MALRITLEEIATLRAESPVLGHRLLEVPREISKLQRQISKEIDEHMQPWVVLLDESVRFFIYFERLQYTRKFTKAAGSFAMQVARLRSLAISIRTLVFLGQESPAHALCRTFLDDLEVATVAVDDPEFAATYMTEDRNHDEADFWKNNIGYGRIYSRLEKAMRSIGVTKRDAKRRIKYHQKVKNVLSSYVHPSPAPTFRSLAAPSWAHPGMIAMKTLGHTTMHMPNLCMFVAGQSHMFAGAMMNQIMRDPRPNALVGLKKGRVMNQTFTSAFLLQELLTKYEDRLEQEAKRRSREVAP
jgi:hypothetical protein